MTPQIHSTAMYTKPHELDALFSAYTAAENWALENFSDDPAHKSWGVVNERYAEYLAAKAEYKIASEVQSQFDAAHDEIAAGELAAKMAEDMPLGVGDFY